MPARLLTCVRCGTLFLSGGDNTCPACLRKEEDEYVTVRRYLSANPKTPAEQVSEATGVPVFVITEFVRHGRLDADTLPDELVAEWIRNLDAAQKLRAQFLQQSGHRDDLYADRPDQTVTRRKRTV